MPAASAARTSAPEPAKGSHHHSARNPRANARSAVQRSTMPVGICIGGDPFFIAGKNSRREIRNAAETLGFWKADRELIPSDLFPRRFATPRIAVFEGERTRGSTDK